MYRLMIITVSTREGRKGGLFAKWIEAIAAADPEWDIEAVDLAALDLPMLTEPEHPRLKHYRHDYTRAWSAKVDAADAFIAVTPEYNYGAPPSLVNALDHLFQEWAYKPMAFVSYGGLAGGTRSVQMLKQILTSLKVVPLTEAVHVPFFTSLIDQGGKLLPNDSMGRSAATMLAELKKWTGPLKGMRG